MELYEKIRRPLTWVICVFFVAGLLMSFLGGTGAVGVIGNIVLILALIPAGIVWIMERKRQEKQNDPDFKPSTDAEPDEKEAH